MKTQFLCPGPLEFPTTGTFFGFYNFPVIIGHTKFTFETDYNRNQIYTIEHNAVKYGAIRSKNSTAMMINTIKYDDRSLNGSFVFALSV